MSWKCDEFERPLLRTSTPIRTLKWLGIYWTDVAFSKFTPRSFVRFSTSEETALTFTPQLDNQLQKYLRYCTSIGLQWSVRDHVLAIPPPPLSLLLAIQDHTQTLDEQLSLNGREGGGGGGGLSYLADVWPAAILSKRGQFFVGLSQYFCNWL